MRTDDGDRWDAGFPFVPSILRFAEAGASPLVDGEVASHGAQKSWVSAHGHHGPSGASGPSGESR